jgi:Rad3-related DNA helicase
MVREEEKHLIRQCVDALREGIPGFKSRRPQMEMIAAVANTLSRCRAEDEQAGNGDHLAIVEAGTGTGKSFGALVPALVMAKSRQKRLVVSSSTVALQHQYAEKDAPSLQRLVPIPFTFAVAKGRRRYACTAKMQAEGKLAGQGGLALAGRARPRRCRRRTPAGGSDEGVAGFLRRGSMERGSGTNCRCPWSTRCGIASPRIGRAAPVPSARSSHAARSKPRGSGSRRRTS